MSNPEIHLLDQRLLEISRQVRDWREGWKMTPPLLLRAIPSKWRRAVEMWANPPSIKDLGIEAASSLCLEEVEQAFFTRSFFWRVGNQLELDLRRRNSSRTPFWTDPTVRDDPINIRTYIDTGFRTHVKPYLRP